MISAWRLVKTHHQLNAFDGEGARRYGGRWNRIGTPMVYTSESLALAVMEYFVHLDIPSNDKLQFSAIKVSIAKNLFDTLEINDLPENWQQNPPPFETQIIGSQWVQENVSVALKIPSILVPTEYNYLLNPNHPQFNKIMVEAPIEFKYDERMYKK